MERRPARREPFVPSARAKKIWIASFIGATQKCFPPKKLTHCAFPQHRGNPWCVSSESAGGVDCAVSRLRRKLPADIRRGQTDCRTRSYDVCHRLALVFVNRGCQKAVDDIFHVRPVDHHRHTRDLSVLIDVAGRDHIQVGTWGEKSVQVEHFSILPEKSASPASVEVEGAPHCLALVIDAGGKSGSIAKQKVALASDRIVLPNRRQR